MRLVFILFLILSSSSQAVFIKNGVSDYRDGCFVDTAGNEVPLKLLLTKVSFPDDDRNGTPNSYTVLLDQSLRFGEALEINFADYCPNHELGDDIFLSAYFDVQTNHMFAKKQITTQVLLLAEDDTLVFWADVFFAQPDNVNAALQQFYMLQYYVAGIEQERLELLLGPDDSESEEEQSG